MGKDYVAWDELLDFIKKRLKEKQLQSAIRNIGNKNELNN